MFFFEFVQFCDVVLIYAAGTLYYYKKIIKTIYKNVQIKGFWLQLIMLLCKTDKHSICLTCNLIGHKDNDNEIYDLDMANHVDQPKSQGSEVRHLQRKAGLRPNYCEPRNLKRELNKKLESTKRLFSMIWSFQFTKPKMLVKWLRRSSKEGLRKWQSKSNCKGRNARIAEQLGTNWMNWWKLLPRP